MCFAVNCRVVACSTMVMLLFDMYNYYYFSGTMPKKIRLGRHYKNEERKKRAAKAHAAASAVSETLVISFPLQLFTETSVSSPDILERRLKATSAIPSGNALNYSTMRTCFVS